MQAQQEARGQKRTVPICLADSPQLAGESDCICNALALFMKSLGQTDFSWSKEAKALAKCLAVEILGLKPADAEFFPGSCAPSLSF
jgi:hypothetical protein